MRSSRITVLLAAAGLAVSASAATGPRGGSPTVSAAVLEGDTVAGVGLITRIDNVAINNSGMWVVEADTDNADTEADSVVVNNSGLFLREGQALTMPVGSTLDSFDAININGNGDSGVNFFLDGTTGGSDDSGIFFNDVLVVQEGTISTAAEFSAGTPYIGFFEAWINDSNQIFVMASVDDPAIATTVDRALVILAYDEGAGTFTESVLYKEGDILPGQTEAVADFGTGPHDSGFNNAGQILFFADLTGDTAVDGVVYLDSTLLAQEGSASPISGRNYEFLSSRGRGLGDNGHWIIKANLDGDTTTDEVIVADGAVVAQEGSGHPDIGAFLFTGFGTGSGPVQIDSAGRVLFFGDWDDPDTDLDTGLFFDGQLIVQEGVSTVGGVIIDTIASGSDAFDLSPDGTRLIFEAVLVDGREGAFVVELPPAQAPCPGDYNMDGVRNTADFFEFFADFFASPPDADYNMDGATNTADFFEFFADFFGPPCV